MFLAKQSGSRIQSRIRRWSLSRQPRQSSVRLTRKTVYILPTRTGLVFLMLLALLLVMAINYENNLIYALTFLLGSLFLVTILHTYNNLAGVEVSAAKGTDCHAGEQAHFQLRLSQTGQRDRIRLQLPEGTEREVDLTNSVQLLDLSCPAKQRGWLRPEWVRLETIYPLGLFRAWSWCRLDLSALVFPAPLESPLPDHLEAAVEGSLVQARQGGTEEYVGLERFRPGMSPRQIDWKSLARGHGLQAKQFADLRSPELWLDLDAMGGETLERRLSRLTGWVLRLSQEDLSYGLKLGAFTLPPSSGEQQRYQALKALALHGLESAEVME